MATVRAPSPRFKRPATPPVVQLTDDDDRILFHVFRHRVIDAAMLYALFPERSQQKLSRRLNALRKAGYIDRPVQQMERVRTTGGSAPLVYAIDRRGAERLRDVHGLDLLASRWRQKNREIRGRSIQHGLSTTRFMVSLELATRAHGATSLLHTDQLMARFLPERKAWQGAPLTLRTRVDWHGYRGEEGTAPDRAFALHYHDRPSGRDHQVFLLEIDQGTETIEPGERRIRSRSFFRDTSLLRKFVVYASTFRARAHRAQLGVDAFRVLTVTTSSERAAQMQATYQKHLSKAPNGVNPGLFLFTDWQSWAAQVGERRYVENGAGKRVELW